MTGQRSDPQAAPAASPLGIPRGFRWPALLAAGFLAMPLVGLLVRLPWSEAPALLLAPEVRESLALSVVCSLAAAICAGLLGLPMALWLAAGRSRCRGTVRILVTLPMVLPPVVAGVALLLAFGRNGMVGAPLYQWFGVSLPFHPAGVVLAEAYVALPFFVLTLEGGLRSLDPRFGEAAATLGAGPWRVLRTVTLPLLAPILGAGLLVAWARALGEFGATITFAGNLPGTTRTLPLAVYVAMENEPDQAIVLSLLLMVVSIGVLVLMRRSWWPTR